MSQRYDKLKTLLKELFQLDQPDLDFGLYRIMHAKSAEVTQFLDTDLLPQVKAAFSLYKTADKAELQKQLADSIAQAHSLGVDPETTQKVKDLRAKLKTDAVDIAALESEVYDDLYAFFRRYYSEGDFLAKRVYKPGVYAIPYEGEEVKLYWANADQYYIKTSEYLRDYAFRLRPEDEKTLRVHFRLADAAEGEHGNVKAAEGRDRVFVPVPDGTATPLVSVEAGELVIRFEYRPATLTDWPASAREGKTKPPGQKDLIASAAARVLASTEAVSLPWIDGLAKAHVLSDGEKADYTRLEAHLRRYTARNTFDYFIHKDLGGFLRRELDFYIKNEVMHLDDVENEGAPRVEQYLSKIRVLRTIAGKIIDFLAQLEDFQKKLWVKTKFVVETSYCFRLGIIPEHFYPAIAANEAQRREWVDLCAIDSIGGDLNTPAYTSPLSEQFLAAHPSLVVDTTHFDSDFVFRLIAAVDHFDARVDVTLLNGENFHALALLGPKYTDRFKCMYLDPPYNTDAGPIDYKNGYRSSSWMSMMQSRLWLSRDLLADDGVLCVTIDDYQLHELATLLDGFFGKERALGTAVIRNNPSGRPSVTGLSISHEYALFYAKHDASLERLPRSEQQLERFSQEDGQYVNWQPFLKGGGSVTYRTARPKQYYPIFVSPETRTLRIPALVWNHGQQQWDTSDAPAPQEVVVWPIDERGNDRIWSLSHTTALANLHDLEVRVDPSSVPKIYRRHRPADGVLPRSWWDKSVYGAREYGTAALAQLFSRPTFSFAKSPFAVEDCLRVSGLATDDDGEVLDYFAGSGTTGHAVINLNRADGGQRKCVLVEQAEYFDTVLVPRLKKVTFSPEWNDGRPRRPATLEEADRGPRILKIVRLESYEDALNNLSMRRTKAQQTLLDTPMSADTGGLKEQYMLRYMLDVETRGSQSLLNVKAFTDPTAYKLNVKRPGSDESREVNVDLLETFNWLIGLTVQHIAAPQTFGAAFERDAEKRLRLKGRLKQDADRPWWFRTVTGLTPDGRRTLVIWRKLTGEPERDNLVLDEWFTRQGYSTKDFEFSLIYVNGGNNLENLKAPDDTWKVRLIEEDFHRLMFETEGA